MSKSDRDKQGVHATEVVGSRGPRHLSALLRACFPDGVTHSIPRLLVFLPCALLILMLFPHAARAMDAGTGHISGQLLNGSRNNAPVANQSVTLQIAQNNSARDLVTLTTDSQGRYAFSSLESDSSVQYAVYTLYQGAQYVTDLIDLSKTANQQVNLTVYDATTDSSNLAVVQTDILIDKPGSQTGNVTVSESFVFENLGLTTYVGSLDATKGKPNALLFSLPSGAHYLTLDESFNGYKNTQVDTGFASTAAVPPGTSSFSFSFQVPYTGTSMQFSYQAVYPTVAFSLLTPVDVRTTPLGQGLTDQGTSNTQSGVYQLFAAQTLGAGKSVSVQLAGLPRLIATTPVQQAVNPSLIWLVVALIVLLALSGVGGYLYNARRRAARSRNQKQSASATRRSGEPAVSKKSASNKDALLKELLALDQTYEAGKLKKAAYQEQRARLKARLRNLLSEQDAAPFPDKGPGKRQMTNSGSSGNRGEK
jgi:5-hydroxyisourate hydrolase-like protein (transthyretin family)